jgi:hypothetical protein
MAPEKDTPEARQWAAKRRQIQERSLALRQQLFPEITWPFEAVDGGRPGRWISGAGLLSPPPNWKCWTRPASRAPIDDAVAGLNKKRGPRLLDRASLEKAGIVCPFWYARAGVILALEAAELTNVEADEARRHSKMKLKELDSLIEKLVPRMIKGLNSIAHAVQGPLDAAVRLHKKFMHSSSMWRGDALWDEYVRGSNDFLSHAEPLGSTLTTLLKIAGTARQGLINTPPWIFERTFAEKIQQDFQVLTGTARPSWGTVFREYWAAARASAELPLMSGERLLKKLRELED